MKRRTFLSLPGVAVVSHATRADAIEGETEILRLFRQHRLIQNAASVHVPTATGKGVDEEMERLFYSRCDSIENKMMALPCTCAADMAAKMIVVHCEGLFSGVPWDDPVWIEARQITGMAK